MKQKDLMKYTKRGKPRVRATGSGPKPKLPAEKVLSKQIRISLASHARLTALSAERGQHITELVDEAVEAAFSRDVALIHTAKDVLDNVVARAIECPSCHATADLPIYGHGVIACPKCDDSLSF